MKQRIVKSELLKCWVDLAQIAAISDAYFIDRMGHGGYFVGFHVTFNTPPAHAKPVSFQMDYIRELNSSEKTWINSTHWVILADGRKADWSKHQTPQEDLLCVNNLQKEINALVDLWKEYIVVADQIHQIDVMTEGYVDGLPDASSISQLCNQIQRVIHPA